MIRKAIPVLTHVDNLSDMKIAMSAQEQSLGTIANNLSDMKIGMSIQEQSLGMIANNTGETNTAVGTTEDADTATTVIGLLKSIVNKLS